MEGAEAAYVCCQKAAVSQLRTLSAVRLMENMPKEKSVISAMGRMMMIAWKALQASSHFISFPQPLYGRRHHIMEQEAGAGRRTSAKQQFGCFTGLAL